jgi:uncharacterized protein (DUF433 family)
MTTILEDYFDFSQPNYIRIKGHRVGIEHILDYYLQGLSPEKIAQKFPGMNIEKIYAAITYYHAHREEVDTYLEQGEQEEVQAYDKWVTDSAPPPVVQRLRKLRDKHTTQQA